MAELSSHSLLLLPLISAFITLIFLRRKGDIAALLSVATAGGILVFASSLIFGLGEEEVFAWSARWFSLSSWQLEFGVLIDGPAKTLLFVVSFVGFLIHIFSLGYMSDDQAKARYFGGLSIFMFSMLGILFLITL